MESASLLLDHGADIGYIGHGDDDDDGLTALGHAANRGHVDTCSMLMSRGAMIDAHIADSLMQCYNWTQLFKAAIFGQVEECQALIDAGADVDHKDRDDNTALDYAAGEEHCNVCKLLMDSGANGSKALMTALSRHKFKISRCLIDYDRELLNWIEEERRRKAARAAVFHLSFM